MTIPGVPTVASGRRLLILSILLLAFALRTVGLDFQELRGDEAFGYFFSLPPLNEIVEETLELAEPHPVFSYWVQHGWLGMAGESEFALRFAGVWWSLLAVALALPLAAQLGLSSFAGTIAALLMALSPYLIWHAQDARMYNMSLALTMLSTVAAIAWWQSVGVRKVWLAITYLAVTWLALHTHYFSLYIVVAQNIALGGVAIVERTWRKWLQWLGIGVVLLMMWLPWLIAAWGILTNYRGNGDSPTLFEAFVRAHNAFGVGEAMPIGGQLWWALLVVATMGLGMLNLWQRPQSKGRATLWFLLIYWLLPFAATWLSAQNRPIFNERYLVAMVPPVYLLMSTALEGNSGNKALQWLGRAALGCVIIGMALGTMRQMVEPQFSKTRGWRELAISLETLTASIEAADVRIAQNYPDPTLWYYYKGEVPHLVLPPRPHDPTLAASEVTRMIEDGVGRVVLVEQPSDAWDDATIAQNALAKDFVQVAETEVARWPVSIWTRPTNDFERLQVEYVDGLMLTGAQVTPTVNFPGGVIQLFLRWEGSAPTLSGQASVSVQLLNNKGELVAQQDRPLEMASLITARLESYAILLPSILAGGDYQLVVVVYDPSREGAPRRLTMAGDDSYLLSPVTLLDSPDK